MERELLLEKSIMVRMNETSISTDEKSIIGTKALATCVGVLLYSEENKRAIVSHVSNDIAGAVTTIMKLINVNKLDTSALKYAVIPGYYEEHYEVKDTLENFFSAHSLLFAPFSKEELNGSFQVDNSIKESHEFAFDAFTGQFVTDIYPFDLVKYAEETFEK